MLSFQSWWLIKCQEFWFSILSPSWLSVAIHYFRCFLSSSSFSECSVSLGQIYCGVSASRRTGLSPDLIKHLYLVIQLVQIEEYKWLGLSAVPGLPLSSRIVLLTPQLRLNRRKCKTLSFQPFKISNLSDKSYSAGFVLNNVRIDIEMQIIISCYC